MSFLFKLVDDELVLAIDELRLIPQFNELIRRDRGSKGDHAGRLKKAAFAECKFIYFFCDLESTYSTYNDTARRIKSIEAAGLPENYKPDQVVKEAMAHYMEVEYGSRPSLRSLISLERGLDLADQILTVLVKSTQAKLELAMKSVEDDPTRVIDVDGLTSAVNTFVSMSKSFPEAIANIEKVREKVTAEKDSQEVKRGGEMRGNREDPKYLRAKGWNNG